MNLKLPSAILQKINRKEHNLVKIPYQSTRHNKTETIGINQTSVPFKIEQTNIQSLTTCSKK